MAVRIDNRAEALPRLPLWAAIFVLLACATMLALSGWREWTSRSADLKTAEVDMANLARSLTQHAEDTVELADAILIGLASRLETNGTDPAAIARVQSFLDLRKPTLGRIRGLFVYDEAGRWLATTEKVPLAGLNNSDRAYFQHHRQSDDQRPHLGQPVKSRSGGQWIITVSRRLNHPDGTFAGVVLATIDAAYFSQFYSRFDLGPNGAVTLLSANGILLARSPDDGTYVGRDMSRTPLLKERTTRPFASTYYFKSPLDGVRRLSAYRFSERYPLLLLATEAQEDVLAPWRQGALIRTAIVLTLTAVIGAIGLYLVRQLFARQRLAAALAATEADFRLLAEESSDMVMRIGFDECILYASPSTTRVLGWDPEQLVGTPALAGVNQEDLPRVEQTVASLKRGDIEETKIIYRTRHREKTEIWIETALRATRTPVTGMVDGVVAISRDMTEHKDLEDKLAALAALDGLTGLANRRSFDERLEQEWARAAREGTPLSLLMIDIDHFKKYNDRYGHPAGDSCLRTVAGILAAHARRPADLAARYGGEELALLLPTADFEGCEQVGARLLEALRDAQIPHALNPPSELVTASMGGASAWPDPAASKGCISLVEAADRALYFAKEAGRDRLVMSGQVMRWPHTKRA
ncbi:MULTISPECIES: diguanylate cyclase [unclassified Bosea (in: a-proteobacteria)]|uniref:diguanylate cyclase domain-containing protein n=1 Tax=unclassified Bosea (in: a-proteobacteria) TaxID=2653178 RepID=UPI000F754AA8|nr:MULTISPECIES: diguanylate cyclase [unclassified Bosea (in: a-proteobacteria)]AZO82182.1 diguanylate cyclase [Bosea sp. Tri-49]RXT24934.1 diguanylate cyclase [Bosea sp. Tri-39]RXT33467.1 diguanylate cyclase [Bosea sp. Tri-54]